MTHSDDNGLVLPPKLAPNQVVIVPIYRSEEQFNLVSDVANQVMKELRAEGIRVKFDHRDTHKPGWKFNEYELKGVPVRLATSLVNKCSAWVETNSGCTGKCGSLKSCSISSSEVCLATTWRDKKSDKLSDKCCSIRLRVESWCSGIVKTRKRCSKLASALLTCIPQNYLIARPCRHANAIVSIHFRQRTI